MSTPPAVHVLVYPAPDDQVDETSTSVMWIGDEPAAHRRAQRLAAEHGSCSIRLRPADVVLATGERRPVMKHFSNGYGCPWCECGIPDGEAGCPNPGCPANPRWTEDEVRTQVERWRAEAVRRADAERAAEFSRRYAEEERAERERLWIEVADEAARRGSCPECLRQSAWQFGRPRYVKHRSADFHGCET
jgi:hypothetical protein